jgi:teichoic acid transport system ATP-binding protein
MSDDIAIRVRDVSKLYKLYDKNSDRFKEALGLTRKKLYHEHYALHHINFDVKRGETVGIIGTNGAGKSTILKIITGVLTPTDGEVEIHGRISALLELGAGFNQEYTGMENIYLNGTMMGLSREQVEEKIPEILSFADIGDFINQPVKTYSSGMFVRLAFAVAINIDPDILIVDEALSVGDIFFQAKCYNKFDEFKREGKTILLVSHDLSSVAKYCDRVILFNKGEKLTEGAPKEMINLYKKILTGTDRERDEIDRKYGKTPAAESVSEKKQDSAVRSSSGEIPDSDSYEEHSIRTNDTYGSDWKKHFEINPNLNEYGNRHAEICDFAVMDENGMLTNAIIKGSHFCMKTKVHFNETVKNPIFTYTFKTVRGLDVTGTNTMFENKIIPVAKKGENFVVTYDQNMDLQGGEYLLSMSCTGYVNGSLVAYHRCYDLISVIVISDKDTVGFYDMNSKVEIEKV